FTTEAAKSFIVALNEEGVVPWPFELAPNAYETLEQELGWLSPYYLRQIALEIRPSRAVSASKRPIATAQDVENAIARLLLPNRRMHFAPWEEHIRKNFSSEDARKLTSILSTICGGPQGEVEGTILSRLDADGVSLKLRELKDFLIVLF